MIDVDEQKRNEDVVVENDVDNKIELLKKESDFLLNKKQLLLLLTNRRREEDW